MDISTLNPYLCNMFTGIITNIGHVVAISKNGDAMFRISTDYDVNQVDMGASISCSGCCLTVMDKGQDPNGKDWFMVQVSDETLSKTTLGSWEIGTKVNLERALKVGDELGGHFVTGHVDVVTKILNYQMSKDSIILEIEIPLGFEKYIAQKGSVTLDGVSLTVNNVYERSFEVNIIPHTQKWTRFGSAQIGDLLNLEIDPLARYVERYNSAGNANLKMITG